MVARNTACDDRGMPNATRATDTGATMIARLLLTVAMLIASDSLASGKTYTNTPFGFQVEMPAGRVICTTEDGKSGRGFIVLWEPAKCPPADDAAGVYIYLSPYTASAGSAWHISITMRPIYQVTPRRHKHYILIDDINFCTDTSLLNSLSSSDFRSQIISYALSRSVLNFCSLSMKSCSVGSLPNLSYHL